MKLLTIFVVSFFCIDAHANVDLIDALYKSNNINGSLLIESLDRKTRYEYKVSYEEGFLPASTFKIPNTLIILEEGLINDEADVIKWDGKQRAYESWNQNQTLKSAFQYSCVWCYQRYASRVGDANYREYLKKFDYGNFLTGSDVTTFWLLGELRITVPDQIGFLRKVHSEELPVQAKHIKTLKKIMLSEENTGHKIWSKTGWAGKSGWYVGYIEVNDETWFFANHIKVSKNDDLVFRKKLVMESLKLLGIIK